MCVYKTDFAPVTYDYYMLVVVLFSEPNSRTLVLVYFLLLMILCVEISDIVGSGGRGSGGRGVGVGDSDDVLTKETGNTAGKVIITGTDSS